MKYKAVLLFIVGLALGLSISLIGGCLSLKSPDSVIREPDKPGQSTVEYTPAPAPRLSLEFASETGPMLATMLGPEMIKVTDDIRSAVGYGFGTINMIRTGEGLVIIDTGVSTDAAEEVLGLFRKVTDEPIRYIIYTHAHQDHTLGSSVFYSEGVEVIATDEFEKFRQMQDDMLAGHLKRARSIQFGFVEPDYAFPLPVSGGPTMFMQKEWPEVVDPTMTFRDTYDFNLGNKKFHLFLCPGETPGTLAVWLPDEKILILGDNYYHSFPNLSTPLLEPRPVRDWIESLEKYIELEPEIMVLGHTNPLFGKKLIKERLINYRDAVKYVHDETVRCINEGKSVDEAVMEIKLPERLAKLPYLQEYYGKVDWSVRGIYRGYTGWYKGEGTGLQKLPPSYAAREVVDLVGPNAILKRAIELQKAGEHQLCAELCDIVIHANPDDKMANRIKAESMYRMAYAMNNLNMFLCYRSAYSMNMKAAGMKPPEKSAFSLGY